jgi:hypothetical protein
MPRRLVIDVNTDLPHRSTRPSTEALSQVFGGCLGEFVDCARNNQCCSSYCGRTWWISSEHRWQYQCLPASARG